jgi:hypothetical protein
MMPGSDSNSADHSTWHVVSENACTCTLARSLVMGNGGSGIV